MTGCPRLTRNFNATSLIRRSCGPSTVGAAVNATAPSAAITAAARMSRPARSSGVSLTARVGSVAIASSVGIALTAENFGAALITSLLDDHSVPYRDALKVSRTDGDSALEAVRHLGGYEQTFAASPQRPLAGQHGPALGAGAVAYTLSLHNLASRSFVV